MSNKINYNQNQKEKEQKIINYYKKLGELSYQKKLEKTKPIKRTRKNIGGSLDLDHENKEYYKENQIIDHKQTKKNSDFIVWD